MSLRSECPHAKVDLFKRCRLLEATDTEDSLHTGVCNPLRAWHRVLVTKQTEEMLGNPLLTVKPFPATTGRWGKAIRVLCLALSLSYLWALLLCSLVFSPVDFFFNILFIYLFIYGCVGSSFLCEGFLQLRQVGAILHRGARASHYHGLSLRSTGSRRAGSAIVAHGPSCSAACGILPDQGANPCPLHWQADSQPLRHQGSPSPVDFYFFLDPFSEVP